MAEKDGDLMEQVRNTKYDEESYFELCKEQVLDIINNTTFQIYDGLIFFRKLSKYFNLNFSKEIRDIISTNKYQTPPELLNESEKNAIQELKKQEYFLYNDYYNRICGNRVRMHAKWLIDKNNFGKTICNFLKADYLFGEYEFLDDFLCKINELNEIIGDYYSIKEDNEKEFRCSVIPRYNTEIIQAVENEPSLQAVMKYYHQNDIKKALGELRKITEFSNKKNAGFEKFIKSQSTELQEMCQQVYKFITNYENHDGKFADATETEVRVWFDLGISIYRLFTIYGDL